MSLRDFAGKMQGDVAYWSRMENDLLPYAPNQNTIAKVVGALKLSREVADELYVRAGKLPTDIESILLKNPQLFRGIRKRGK